MLKITSIPAFENNYFWIIQPDPAQDTVFVVDPGAAQPVLDYLCTHQLKLGAILITHRHNDHIGGVNDLLTHYPVSVYGPRSDAIPQVTVYLGDNDHFELGELNFHVIAVPGHTWEHIAFYLPQQKTLFCGDALFAGGCGRRFDGTAEIMWDSLQKLAALPDDTRIYCAHEYTLSNLRFALAVEPDNADLQERLHHVEQLRANHQITLPSIILLEKRTNPFLRCQENGAKIFIKSQLGETPATAAEAFGALRAIKDTWPAR
ncbi:MAG: hydroxyacylglutathione hydrolase [Cellvibrio sp. 79]|nr:MAG: hydroxyacylglutathione hydrolase [Cellvibrio sp. 79]